MMFPDASVPTLATVGMWFDPFPINIYERCLRREGVMDVKSPWANIDRYRKVHLAMAEMIDAWRVVPRLLVGGYAYLVYLTVKWYMALEPHVIPGCMPEGSTVPVVAQCLEMAPTTQHAALVTIIVSISAAVLGLYTGSGKKWESGFNNWNKDDDRDGDGLLDTIDEDRDNDGTVDKKV
jgi:hypothetical protein